MDCSTITGELLFHTCGYSSCLQAAGEAHEVRTETEASTLSRRHADRRGDQVQDGENSRGHKG